MTIYTFFSTHPIKSDNHTVLMRDVIKAFVFLSGATGRPGGGVAAAAPAKANGPVPVVEASLHALETRCVKIMASASTQTWRFAFLSAGDT
jgi:hypothetical protein